MENKKNKNKKQNKVSKKGVSTENKVINIKKCKYKKKLLIKKYEIQHYI